VLRDTKILMTGATGMVGRPIAMELARTNEVWAVGRFGDPQARATMEDAGVRTLQADLADTDLPALPGVDFVLNFAVSRTNDWGVDLDVNVDGLGALMYACRSAKAVLHCSTTAVYQPAVITGSPKTIRWAITTAAGVTCSRLTASRKSRPRPWSARVRAG
jgi:UDP-glucuronate 4-epimerase